MKHPITVHPALPGHAVPPIDDAGALGTRTGLPLIPGRSTLVSHLGQQAAVHLAVARMQNNKDANAHELTWVADRTAHPAQKLVSNLAFTDPLIDLGGRSSRVPINISLHHTTPGGAWYKVSPGYKHS